MTTPTPNPNSTQTPTINHPAHDLLLKSHPPSQAATIFTSKIKNKPLLLHPTNDPSTRRALRRHIRHHKTRYHQQRQKPQPLSAREKRSLNLYALSPSSITYDIYAGLNRLWTSYILEVLGFSRDGVLVSDATTRTVTASGQGSLLCAADFHGMSVEVVRCRDVGKVGLKGIVVRETKGTMVLVTPRNQLRTVLKDGAVFRVVVELPGVDDSVVEQDSATKRDKRNLVFELHGDLLQVRPVERAARKFKWKAIDFL